MKNLIIALICLSLLTGLTLTATLYCESVCRRVTAEIEKGTPEGAEKALALFTDNSFIIKLTVDSECYNEALVCLRSHAYARLSQKDDSEAGRYALEALARIDRILFFGSAGDGKTFAEKDPGLT